MSGNPRFKHGDAPSLNQKRLTAHKLLKRLDNSILTSLILTPLILMWLKKDTLNWCTPFGDDEADVHKVDSRSECPILKIAHRLTH